MDRAGNKLESKESSSVSVIPVNPLLDESMFEALAGDADVLVMIVYASGAFPDRLVSSIEKMIGEGRAIIALTDNSADEYGLRSIKYAAGQGAYEAGMRALVTANVKHLDEVLNLINIAYEWGLRGVQLADAVQKHFSLKEGEEFPPEDWDDPEALTVFRELYSHTLRRQGYDGDELEAELKRWEGK